MRIFLVGALLLPACTQGLERQHDKWMDRIEAGVRLPEKAHKLSDYARYYAFRNGDEIVGTYVVPFDEPSGPGVGCEEVFANMTSREIPCPSRKSSHDLAAGKRRWLTGERQLPFRADGGCSIVHVRFKPSTDTVEEVSCNGSI